MPDSVTYSDLDILARTIFGEARGESVKGKIAVAWVVKNRADAAVKWLKNNTGKERHPLFGNGSLIGACRAPFQFSCWNPNDPNYPLIEFKDCRSMWQQTGYPACLHAALSVIIGRDLDPTKGSLHYHDGRMSPPKWADGLDPVVVIGNHKFYNNVD